MTNLIDPTNHVFLKKFRDYVTSRGGKVCVGVKDGDGKIYSIGDRKFMLDHLKEKAAHDRRVSMEWVPKDRALPPLPMPMASLVLSENVSRLKLAASAYVQHFIEDGQHFAMVSEIFIKCFD